jgi:formate dehydrogenase major subunit
LHDIRSGRDTLHTHTPELEAGRKTILAMLAERYPQSAPQEWPDKQFYRWLRHYGLNARLEGSESIDDPHPYIQVRMSRCINCYRCVRICAEVQGQFVWNIWNRGEATRIVADHDVTLGASSCVSCGACVDTCPTGALEDKHLLNGVKPVSWMRTTCPYCGTGCEMQVGISGDRIVAVRPTMDAPVNQGHLCVKGRYAFEFVHAADRITHPMMRQRGGQWRRVSGPDAIDHIAGQLSRIREIHGANAIGCSGRLGQRMKRLTSHRNSPA